MLYIESVIREKTIEVSHRLNELGLSIDALTTVRDRMQYEFANSTAFHCKNKAGTYAYHEGVEALRYGCIGQDDWQYHFKTGLEGIKSPSRDVVILIAGVNNACQKLGPQPRSTKGNASEQASAQPDLFSNILQTAPTPSRGTTTLWLMVDEFGNAELTHPAVKKGAYVAYVERNFIALADDLEPHLGPESFVNDDVVDDFDPLVARK